MARTPAPRLTRICCVRRMMTLPDHTGDARLLCFTIDGLARRTRFAEIGQVPEFEGEVAWFEMEQRNKTRLGYVFVRQVAEPAPSKQWY
ncbi:hypothetical protein KOAAANKH_03525 [Brevundimonas sp. NIBR10]|uniref:hypothetical protein n=1 Tax=Brevundimonas sp. NIBR10 TaxID=3015997 RepID=UPI0022F1A39E|nr:hypothetical protein [Brevundimonas sp. NIBR10]WGM48622.1 hypothetical protein KOAAANKH_03525 [Brevundimonas sp. NIBR10]